MIASATLTTSSVADVIGRSSGDVGRRLMGIVSTIDRAVVPLGSVHEMYLWSDLQNQCNVEEVLLTDYRE